ncbi:MAG: hypothetical protein CR977_01835 [Gammaproteobacteria bacterium]|nr:MAG: hypothetical protein CR977_01835 [Gammaproteobacteria bacterium]
MFIFLDTFVIGKEGINQSITINNSSLYMSRGYSYAHVHPITPEMFLLAYWEEESQLLNHRKFHFSGTSLSQCQLTITPQDGEFERYKILQFNLTIQYFKNGIYANVKILTGRGDYCWHGGVETASKLPPIQKEQNFFIPLEQMNNFFEKKYQRN